MAVVNKPRARPAAPNPKKPDAKGAGFYCYIGPNIRGLIQTGTIYVGTREEALKTAAAAIERHPIIRTLIVPGETLAADRINIKKPGTALYTNYRRILRGE